VGAGGRGLAGGLRGLALRRSGGVRVGGGRLESPVGTVRRSGGSHLDFWRGVLEDEAVRGGRAPGPDEGDEGGTPGGTS